MGLNTVIYCERHKVHLTSMRGEEGADMQWWFRNHRECFQSGFVKVACDADVSFHQDPEWSEPFEHEDRPDAQRKMERSEAISEARDALQKLILVSR